MLISPRFTSLTATSSAAVIYCTVAAAPAARFARGASIALRASGPRRCTSSAGTRQEHSTLKQLRRIAW